VTIHTTASDLTCIALRKAVAVFLQAKALLTSAFGRLTTLGSLKRLRIARQDTAAGLQYQRCLDVLIGTVGAATVWTTRRGLGKAVTIEFEAAVEMA